MHGVLEVLFVGVMALPFLMFMNADGWGPSEQPTPIHCHINRLAALYHEYQKEAAEYERISRIRSIRHWERTGEWPTGPRGAFATLGDALRHCGAEYNASVLHIAVDEAETPLTAGEFDGVHERIQAVYVYGRSQSGVLRTLRGGLGAGHRNYNLTFANLAFELDGCRMGSARHLTARECIFYDLNERCSEPIFDTQRGDLMLVDCIFKGVPASEPIKYVNLKPPGA